MLIEWEQEDKKVHVGRLREVLIGANNKWTEIIEEMEKCLCV